MREINGASNCVWFVSPDGELFDACMDDCKVESSTALHAEADVVLTGDGPSTELSAGVAISDIVKGTPSKKQDNWFELTEADSDDDGQESLDHSKPQSSLHLVDEALEFELVGLGDVDFFAVEDLNNVDVVCMTGSDGESEEDLNELAAKSFDSDPDMHVPLKKVKE